MIKILTILHTLPSVKSYRTLCFERVLPYLRSKTDVHLTWLVYQPERLKIESQTDPHTSILDIHDFKNAVEVVQQVKPDIIWVAPTLNLPDYALSLAGKHMNIPVVGELVTELMKNTSKFEVSKSYFKKFFESSVPTDVIDSNNKFMRRGRFFLFKYQFVLKTQLAIKMGFLKIIKSFVSDMNYHLSVSTKLNNLYNPKFAVDLHFVETKKLVDRLVKNGFERSSLVPTGIPMYDDVFERLEKIKVKPNTDGKTKILLVTHAMFEHGFWTRSQRDSLVRGIVSEISKHKNEISLTVKIHPSSELLNDYQKLIKPIDDTIPIYKDGDIVEFIKNSDAVIAYSGGSTLVYAIACQKPIIICNFYNLENDIFQEKGVVSECKNKSTIIPLIKEVIESNPITKEKTDDFIEEFFYKLDGRASERIGDSIINLLKIR
tara:strand:- start:1076 stop:2371 length:1296 start_codon:yes stop_codon:yes gene_type:complete